LNLKKEQKKMTTVLIVIGVLVLHFLIGAIFGQLKIKEYLNLIPTKELPWYRRFYRTLLFPLGATSGWPEWPHMTWEGKFVSMSISKYTIFSCCDWDNWPESNMSILKGEKGEEYRKAIKAYQKNSVLFGGLFNLLPLLLGLVRNMLFGIKAIPTVASQTSLEIMRPLVPESNDKLDGLRKFRDQNIAGQRKRLEELSNKTQIGIAAIEKLVQSWQAHIGEIENSKIDIGAERLKSIMEKIKIILAEKKADLAKITQALSDLNLKRQELDGFIRTLELYQETATLIPNMNGAGKSITDQIQENMVAADEAVKFCRKFSEMELEIGARLQLTPETLAKGWIEGLEREDKIISNIENRDKISE